MRKIKILIFSLFLLGGVNIANAGLLSGDVTAEQYKQSEALREKAGFEMTTVEFIVADIIKVFLSLLGIIFVILIIIAGFHWMTASGDEAKIEKAKKLMSRAIIGLIIIVAAYAITKFVFTNLPGGGSGSSLSGS